MVKVLTELISNIPSSFTSKVLPKPLNPGPMISDLFPNEDKILGTITQLFASGTPTGSQLPAFDQSLSIVPFQIFDLFKIVIF